MPFDFAANAWFLTGPTASGKSQLGLEMAERLEAEIISLDSMALYRSLDIGTAKPSVEERARVPHHLIDVIDPGEDFSVAQYLAAAETAVRDIQARGRRALFVGGTPLYLKALLRGLFEGPPADWELRGRWEREAARESPGWLHAQVARVDPASAAKLHPNDTRRLIRALEVFEKTGEPISRWQQQFETARPTAACHVFMLDWPRAELYARIDQRVDAMFAAGWIDEVRNLLNSGTTLSRTAQQAVGYHEILEHLANERDLATTVQLVKHETHRFARKQVTWFRSLSECRRVAMQGDRPTSELTELLASGLSSE